MFTSRPHFVAGSIVAALSLLLAFAWIGRIDQARAQQAAVEKPKAKADSPNPDLAVMKGLEMSLSVDFQDIPLTKSLAYLDEKTQGKLNILLDEPALKEAGVDPNDKLVTLKATKFTIRSILKTLLKPNGLDYYIEDGWLRITSEAKAKEQTIIKLYPLWKFSGLPQLTMYADLKLAKKRMQQIALLLMNTVEPKYWEALDGGPGQIDWDPRNMSLIVKASVEIQYMLMAQGLVPISWKDLPPIPDHRVTKVYDIAGLLDLKNVERSSAELMKALSLVAGEHGEGPIPTEKAESRPPPIDPWHMRIGMSQMQMSAPTQNLGFVGGGLFPNLGAPLGNGLPSNKNWGRNDLANRKQRPDGLEEANRRQFVSQTTSPDLVGPLAPSAEKNKPDSNEEKFLNHLLKVAQQVEKPLPCAVILSHPERLVVRTTPEIQQQIERMIADLKAPAKKEQK